MINYTFRPLQWDRESTPAEARRSRYTFKASWSDTMKLLARELDYLDAAEPVIIEAAFREQDIRVDGMPRGDRIPTHPGVRIAFRSKYGPLVYATDTHEDWRHNVRAIALSLEALRSVDRYGVTKRAEQYTGWKAIGSGTPMPPGPTMTREQAAAFIAKHADPEGGHRAEIARLLLAGDLRQYRIAARRLHPDAGGSTEEFQQLQRAKDTLNGGR